MSVANRWKAVSSAFDSAPVEYIGEVVERGIYLVGRPKLCTLPGVEGRPARTIDGPIFCAVMQDGPLVLVVNLLFDPVGREAVVINHFPAPAAGVVWRLRIIGVEEHFGGVEGWVSGMSEDGAGISFLAADYYANHERYLEGSVMDIRLSALAYQVMPKKESPGLVADARLREALKSIGRPVPPDDEPLIIRTDEMVGLFPKRGYREGIEYGFAADVKSVRENGDFIEFTGCVVRVDEDFDINIVAAKHSIQGPTPIADGPQVEGAFALIGRLADHSWTA